MRSHRPPLLSLLLAALLAAATLAFTGPSTADLRIEGRVVAADTGAPLQSVQVFVREMLHVGALTDRDGRYVLRVPRAQISGNDLHVIASLVGFGGEESAVAVPADGGSDVVAVDFRLTPQMVAMDELVVTGQAAPALTDRRADAVARRRMEAEAAAGYASAPPAPPSVTNAAGKTMFPGGSWRHAPEPNREQYAYIEENGFQATKDHPLSTFSIDVDRASYSNIRRFLLRERQLPPVDAVQIEEMVNYFSYGYERPSGKHPVAVTTEVGRAPWAHRHLLLRVGLASRPVETENMPPANLVFLLDVSGSMQSDDKLPLVKASMRMLVERLRREDRVAIVVYAGAAGLVLEPTTGAHRGEILEAIERLEAGGSTAGGEGLRLAYEVARRHFQREGNNRVILATDGDFNVGESSDASMIRLVEAKRGEGTFLTVLGFGTGNLQNEKMQSLAQYGNGNYAYIDGLQEARKVLVGEMGATLLTVAKDVKVQIEFNPERVRSYRLLGYENRLLAAEDFNDDKKDAGEMGAGHNVTALYEIVPVGNGEDALTGDVDPLRYGRPERAAARPPERPATDELAFVKVRYKQPQGSESRLLDVAVRAEASAPSDDLTFASAVAGFGMLLRQSEHRGSITAEQVMALARAGLGEDQDGYRRGFLDLVRAYQEITSIGTWGGR